MPEVGLLLGGVDEGELGGNAVGMVFVLGAALRFAPRVFRVVDSAQARVFHGRPGYWFWRLLGGACDRKQDSCIYQWR